MRVIIDIDLVARAGFEPAISALRGRRPKPLDERANFQNFVVQFRKKINQFKRLNFYSL